MRVLIAGIDGYLGWPLAQYLTMRSHTVGGLDMLLRRRWVEEVGGVSALPVFPVEERLDAFRAHFGVPLDFWRVDLVDYPHLKAVLAAFKPDAIVHLAEMPSAPYSMIDQAHAVFTQHNNVLGSLNLLWAMKEVCPEAALAKLGTMGEYGTPGIDIPEGFFEIEYRGRKDVLPFPRQAGSFYHWSKVHDSNNTMFACRTWGLSATDIMQGVVFGTRIDGGAGDPRLSTRLDFDQCFGTAVNRFCCQAVIGHPLTLYGQGFQKRGFIPLRDAMQCLALALENPPAPGEYRVFNQFEACYSLDELAGIVQQAAAEIGLGVTIAHYDNPRIEKDDHYYNPDREHLIRLGYRPSCDTAAEIQLMLRDLLPHHQRILDARHVLVPNIRWDGNHRLSRVYETEDVTTQRSDRAPHR